MDNMQEEIVFSVERVAPASGISSPVVVVGLPRSGSSFLAHSLSELPEYYVFDDLSLINRPIARKAKNQTLSEADIDELLTFLGWQIRARLRYGLYAIPRIEENDIERLNVALKTAFASHPGTVWDLQEEWIFRLASAENASQWGFKMPRAFLSADDVFSNHQTARMVFIMRQPEDVLASYKNMPMEKGGDGDPRRYHPIFYALYWRLAARSYLKLRQTYKNRILLVRFDEFVQNPVKVTNHIAQFLETEPLQDIEPPKRQNTSYRKGAKIELTGLEFRIVSLICRTEMKKLGFQPKECPPSIAPSDFLDLARSTFVSLRFRLWQSRRRK